MKFFIGIIVFIVFFPPLTIEAETPDAHAHLNLDASGLAIEGYDPVSYHTGNLQKGENAFSVDHNGARYLFSGQDNRMTFQSNPEKYIPAFGGWCAWAMLEGEKVEVDPETFKIVDGTTYLFYNFFWNNTLSTWNSLSDQETESVLAERAQAEWEKLNH